MLNKLVGFPFFYNMKTREVAMIILYEKHRNTKFALTQIIFSCFELMRTVLMDTR